MAALGCQTSLGLICQITESSDYDILLGSAMESSVYTGNIRMVRLMARIAKSKLKHEKYTHFMYEVAEYAASGGKMQILEYCREQFAYCANQKFYEQELTTTAAAEGHVACMLMGLRDWKSRCAHYAMAMAAQNVQYETFRLCHEWGGKINDHTVYDMNQEYNQMLRDDPQSEYLADQKAIVDYCHKWYPRESYVEEHYWLNEAYLSPNRDTTPKEYATDREQI